MSQVTLLADRRSFQTRPDETVLDAMRRLGYSCRYGCRRGGCGTCKADVMVGTVRYTTVVAPSVLSLDERAAGTCLLCRAVPVGDIAVQLRCGPVRSVFGTLQS